MQKDFIDFKKSKGKYTKPKTRTKLELAESSGNIPDEEDEDSSPVSRYMKSLARFSTLHELKERISNPNTP